MANVHIPVLQKEAIEYLNPKPNENFIDATLGGGGHALAILERNSPKGKILGIDADPEIIHQLKSEISSLKSRIVLVCDNFANLKKNINNKSFRQISGILFDLGLSSWHLEKSGRGFSFLRKEQLDMRYNFQNPLTAEKILNYWSVQEIEKILTEYGEERFAKEIAGKIVEARKLKQIKNTVQLAEIIKRAVPGWYLHRRLHFATKTFQALRIAVNDELNNLEKVLPQAVDTLEKNGRLVIISFHSLEDRIVKNFFREMAEKNIIKILTKKPIKPNREEIKINPRSRSAMLRAAQKL